MKRSKILTMVAVSSMMAASLAFAHTHGGAQASGQGAAAATTKGAQATTDASASAQAEANADVQALRAGIVAKAAKVSAKVLEKTEARIEATASSIDKAVQKEGEVIVASRLAAEFNTTADALIAERQELKESWGDMTVAHTIAANSKTEVTARQLAEWQHGGMGWAQLAAGLGLDLNSVASSVRTEARVASGLAQADGRVAVMRGEGARVGADTGIRAGVGTQNTGATVGAGVGAGVKIGR